MTSFFITQKKGGDNKMSNEFRQFKRVLENNGYKKIRVKGSHYIFKGNQGNIISVPKDLNRMIQFRLIKENNLNVRL